MKTKETPGHTDDQPVAIQQRRVTFVHYAGEMGALKAQTTGARGNIQRTNSTRSVEFKDRSGF